MNKKCFAYLLVALCMISCDIRLDIQEPGNNSLKSLKLQKLDIAGSKYLYMAQTASSPNQVSAQRFTRSEGQEKAGLFKMDADGNISGVLLTCVETSDSTNYTTRTDLTLIPREMTSFSDTYTLMTDCEIIDSEGNTTGVLQNDPGLSYTYHIIRSYSTEDYSLNILVRNSDGKIFYLPEQSRIKYFYSNYVDNEGNPYWGDVPTTVDDKGNFYIACQVM